MVLYTYEKNPFSKEGYAGIGRESNLMICNKCGKEISDDSSFCNYCGTKLVPEMPQPVPAVQPIPPVQPGQPQPVQPQIVYWQAPPQMPPQPGQPQPVPPQMVYRQMPPQMIVPSVQPPVQPGQPPVQPSGPAQNPKKPSQPKKPSMAVIVGIGAVLILGIAAAIFVPKVLNSNNEETVDESYNPDSYPTMEEIFSDSNISREAQETEPETQESAETETSAAEETVSETSETAAETETETQTEAQTETETQAPAKQGWIQDGNKWYYYDSNGTMAVNTWKNIDGYSYYFGPDGAMYANTTTPDGQLVDNEGRKIDTEIREEADNSGDSTKLNKTFKYDDGGEYYKDEDTGEENYHYTVTLKLNGSGKYEVKISDGRNKTTKTGTYTYSPEDEIIEFSGYLDTAGYCDGETIEINIDDIGDIYLE